MNKSVSIKCLTSDENFDEAAYLAANPDVAAAVASGEFAAGWEHFEEFGRAEGRSIFMTGEVMKLRARKFARLEPFLRRDISHEWNGGKVNYLTDALREATKIIDTNAVSSNGYDGNMLALMERYAEGLVLDCGAGSRDTYYDNVVNYEIVDYPSTDVIGVGEELPFQDGTFDAIISVAVLEHVRDPFRCAQEISRVLKPGGQLYCSVPFLQPYHGYPHHYFNATPQGIRRLFEDQLSVDHVRVLDSTHPVWALHWILKSWTNGLPPNIRASFGAMSVDDFLQGSPAELVSKPFCQQLSTDSQLELACATVLEAHKRPAA